MLTIPVTVFLTTAAGLGFYLFTRHPSGVRRTGLITLHFLLGAAGLLQLVIVQRGTPRGDILTGNRFGSLAAGLFALSLISGLLAQLLARDHRGRTSTNSGTPARGNTGPLLNIHAAIGSAGFLLFLAWLVNL